LYSIKNSCSEAHVNMTLIPLLLEEGLLVPKIKKI